MADFIGDVLMWAWRIIRLGMIGILISLSGLWSVIRFGKAQPSPPVLVYISSPIKLQSASLYLMDVSRRVSFALGQFDDFQAMPMWSPDGAHLLFVIGGGYNPTIGRTTPTRILYTHFPTYHTRTLTNNARTISESAPTWSVTGRIAYARYANSHWDIALIYPNIPRTQSVGNTIQSHRTLNTPANEHTPRWSPDGMHLAYLTGGQYVAELWLADAYGENPRSLTDGMRLYDRQYQWSPSGTHIVFTSERDGNREIYIVNVANGALTNLSRHQHHDVVPRWSPDGAQIAFISGRVIPHKCLSCRLWHRLTPNNLWGCLSQRCGLVGRWGMAGLCGI